MHHDSQTEIGSRHGAATPAAPAIRRRWLSAVVTIVMAIVAAGCTTGTDQAQTGVTSPVEAGDGIDEGSDPVDSPTSEPQSSGDALFYTPDPDGTVCDGNRREIGRLANADAYEPLDFDAPDSPFVLVGEADADGTFALYWKCPPSMGNQQWSVTATGGDSGRSVTFTIDGRLPPPPNAGGISVDVVENPFSCDGDERILAELTNLTPNVEVELGIEPPTEAIVGTKADAEGNLSLYWRCSEANSDTTWRIDIVESTPDPRRALFRFQGTDEPYQPPAFITETENPFRCDATSHEFAVLSGFVPNEFVRFTSPQSENIRGGQADENGVLPIRWYCEADDVDKRWQVTATGQTSLATVTFIIIAGPPG